MFTFLVIAIIGLVLLYRGEIPIAKNLKLKGLWGRFVIALIFLNPALKTVIPPLFKIDEENIALIFALTAVLAFAIAYVINKLKPNQ